MNGSSKVVSFIAQAFVDNPLLTRGWFAARAQVMAFG
jgi:hypothetical protein